jgi:hypothetical protein
VSIDSKDVALAAVNSFITATVVKISGRVAIHAENSQLDLAGASIEAQQAGVTADATSRVYFSVSDMQSADFSGDVHRIWSTPPPPSL